MITVTGAEPAVQTLFNPRSVAVIGASSKPGTLSWWPLRLLVQYGFAGGVHPVNPSRSEIEGVPCVASLADVGGPVDLAVIALNAKNTVQAVRDCAAMPASRWPCCPRRASARPARTAGPWNARCWPPPARAGCASSAPTPTASATWPPARSPPSSPSSARASSPAGSR
ncbi:CoA-binding protein [Nonomuraea ferruginea]